VTRLSDVLDARITETIATTEDEDGAPNAAPMGVRDEDDGLYAYLWEGSTTLGNVRATNRVVVNVTRDPVAYVEAALGDGEGGEVEFVGTAKEASSEGPPRLRDADAWFVCDATRVEGGREGVTRWRLEDNEGTVKSRVVPTFSRGFASVVEATVHATRLGIEPDLRDLYEHHVETARKCGGEREREAADLLVGYAEG